MLGGNGKIPGVLTVATTSNRHVATKPVSATEAKNNFGAVLAHAQLEPVIIETRGHPTAVVVSIEVYEELERARYENERRAAVERLRTLRSEAERRNSDLTPEQADELVKEIVDDTFARMIAEGKIRYDE